MFAGPPPPTAGRRLARRQALGIWTGWTACYSVSNSGAGQGGPRSPKPAVERPAAVTVHRRGRGQPAGWGAGRHRRPARSRRRGRLHAAVVKGADKWGARSTISPGTAGRSTPATPGSAPPAAVGARRTQAGRSPCGRRGLRRPPGRSGPHEVSAEAARAWRRAARAWAFASRPPGRGGPGAVWLVQRAVLSMAATSGAPARRSRMERAPRPAGAPRRSGRLAERYRSG